MINNETEIWRSYPDIPEIEVSTLGIVRTLDRVVSSKGNGTRFQKGQVLKQFISNNGYMRVHIRIDGKSTMKLVHRLVAQTFIKNTDNLPQVNHRDCDPTNNDVSNLEWCSSSYNIKYREKYGKAQNKPVFAIDLSTLEVLHFRSQGEASRELGVFVSNISRVIKGKQNYAGGYFFKEDDGNGIEIDKDKLNDIVDGMPFKGKVFAVDLNTSEVSQFESQMEASRALGINSGNISMVIKGSRNQSGGYWFVNDDKNADDAISRKLQEIKKTKLVLYR